MQYLIYGSGLYAHVLKRILHASDKQFIGFIDDFREGTDIEGNYQEIKNKFSPQVTSIIIGIGYKHFLQRQEIYHKLIHDNYIIPKLIHPKAIVEDEELVGTGSVIMAGAIVDANTKIGNMCVIWPGACINHDSQIGDNTFVSPNSTICGCVTVGQSAFIGAGSTITNHVEIQENSFIKAGSLVTKTSIVNTHKSELF